MQAAKGIAIECSIGVNNQHLIGTTADQRCFANQANVCLASVTSLGCHLFCQEDVRVALHRQYSVQQSHRKAKRQMSFEASSLWRCADVQPILRSAAASLTQMSSQSPPLFYFIQVRSINVNRVTASFDLSRIISPSASVANSLKDVNNKKDKTN